MADIEKTIIANIIAKVDGYVKGMQTVQKETEKSTKKVEELKDSSKKAGDEMLGGFASLSDGIGKISPQLSGIAGGFKNAAEGAKSFGLKTKAAIAATGVGIFLLALGSIVSKFQEIGDKSESELSFVERKMLDAKKAAGDWFNSMFDWLKEWAERNKEFIAGLRGVANFFTFGLSDAIINVTEDILAQNAAYERNIELAKELALQKSEDVKMLEDEIKLMQARKQDELDIIEAQQKLIELKHELEGANHAALFLESALLSIKKEQIEAERLLAAQQKMAAEAKTEQERLAAEQRYKEIQDREYIRELNTENLYDMEKMTAAMYNRGKAVVKTVKYEDAQLTARQEYWDQEAVGAQQQIQLAGALVELAFAGAEGSKELAIVQANISAALAILSVWAQPGGNFYLKLIQTVIVAAATLAQIIKIQSQKVPKPPKFASGGLIPDQGGLITGRTHAQGGVKFSVGGYAAEAEGGEFIVNRKATAKHFDTLRAINASGLKRYAEGGIVTGVDTNAEQLLSNYNLQSLISGARPVLVLEDYRRADNKLLVVENLARV